MKFTKEKSDLLPFYSTLFTPGIFLIRRATRKQVGMASSNTKANRESGDQVSFSERNVNPTTISGWIM